MILAEASLGIRRLRLGEMGHDFSNVSEVGRVVLSPMVAQRVSLLNRC